MADASFVNPYNFVPFPEKVVRRRAWGHVGPGHAREGDWFGANEAEPLYSGSIDLTWELQTPLHIPSKMVKEWLDGDTVRLPGSSIKGMTRSLHEAMFNGCARVFDENYLPVHRMPAVLWPPGQEYEWCLAQVVAAKDGRPTRIRLTGDLVFVKASALARNARERGEPALTTGDVIDLDRTGEDWDKRTCRYQLTPRTVTRVATRSRVVQSLCHGTPINGSVFIITDTTVRDGHPAWWATATLTNEYLDVAEDDPAWKRFLKAVEGSDDRRLARNGDKFHGWENQPRFEDIRHNGQALGRRVAQTGQIFVGDVLWARVVQGASGLEVEEFLLSQLWRRAGSGTTGTRAPSALPCRPDEDGGNLCLSCATFGSTDPDKKSESDGSVVSYRGHVRFSAAVASGVQTRTVTRAAMGSPKPSAGGFYLRGQDVEAAREQGDVLTHWGSDGDGKAPLRGRKFYWHSDPDAQHEYRQTEAPNSKPRYEAYPGQPLREEGVRLVSADGNPKLKFTCTVTFDRMPMLAVQALLAALDPKRIAAVRPEHADRRLAIHLAGGKPLGLGSAIPSITSVSLTSVSGRYTGEVAEPAAEPTEEVLNSIEDHVGPAPVAELLRLLDLDGLSEDEQRRVTYPPAAPWKRFGTKAFSESFKFFSANNGEQLEHTARPFTPLPEATDPSQLIEWDRK